MACGIAVQAVNGNLSLSSFDLRAASLQWAIRNDVREIVPSQFLDHRQRTRLLYTVIVLLHPIEETFPMAIQAHLAELERKHETLENELHEALTHPSVDDTKIAELKRRKLQVKDEIERLRAQTVH